VLWGIVLWGATAAGRPAPRPAERLADERELVRHRLAEAARALRRRHRDRYAVPSFLVLGPAGMGKSAALRHSGLTFHYPTARERNGDEATRGAAVWLAEEAIFVEAEGGYATQDGAEEIQAQGWNALIEGIRRQRPLLPLNGIVLTLSLADLGLADGIERDALAQSLRRRLDEAEARLNLHLPVYVLLTKLDLVPGFTDYFDRLDGEQRTQSWGFALPYDDAITGFSPQFDALVEALKARQIENLHRESDPRRCGRILGFPAQLAALKPVAQEVLERIFAADERGARPLLRGVYLASARQDILAIDRLLPALAERFGLNASAALPADVIPDEQEVGAFLRQPLKEVVIAEAGLVCRGRNPYRRRTLRRAAVSLVFLAILAAAGTRLAAAYADQLRTAKNISITAQQAAAERARHGATDIPSLMPLFRLLREDAAVLPVEAPLAPGLSVVDPQHHARLRGTVARTEDEVRSRLLLPLLAGRLETALALARGSRAEIAQALAVYEMMGGAARSDPALERQWLEGEAAALFPAAGDDDRRLFIAEGLAAMAHPEAPVALDKPLVALTQRRLALLAANGSP
jgi:type VI secretion system protein ImpL